MKYKCMQSLKMKKTLFLIVVQVSLTSTAQQLNVLREQAHPPPPHSISLCPFFMLVSIAANETATKGSALQAAD